MFMSYIFKVLPFIQDSRKDILSSGENPTDVVSQPATHKLPYPALRGRYPVPQEIYAETQSLNIEVS